MRRFSRKLEFESLVELLGLLFIAYFQLSLVPIEVWSRQPATGGDTASHFWTLKLLFDEYLPLGTVRGWSPANYFGEPVLVHYFPFPFIVMASLAFFLPIGLAFNLGTFLPIFTFPFAVFLGIKLFRSGRYLAIFSAIFSLAFLYNESFSMWGGNGLSTLAGQFAHLYALNLVIVTIGIYAWESRKDRFPIFSSFGFFLVLVSHSYVCFVFPLFVVGYEFCHRNLLKPWVTRFLICILMATSFSAWFLIPLIENSKWNTAFTDRWRLSSFFEAVLPAALLPYVIASIVVIASTLIFGKSVRLSVMSYYFEILRAYLVVIFGYFLLYLVFPYIGLIDIRALPQIHLMLVLGAAYLVSVVSHHFKCLRYAVLPLLVLSLGWTEFNIKSFESWARWNYSGWREKAGFNDFSSLMEAIRGSYSQPRVAFEHSVYNSRVGTIRAFEMTPYYSGRAVTEGLYLQSSIMAPAAFYFQSLISLKPSCPLKSYSCAASDIKRAISLMQLLGIDTIVLSSESLVAQANSMNELSLAGTFGEWRVYRSTLPVSLVDVFDLKESSAIQEEANESTNLNRKVIPGDRTWKRQFYEYLKSSDGSKGTIIPMYDPDTGVLRARTANLAGNCAPRVEMSVNHIHLVTDCPEKFHVIKVAFSPYLRPSGDIKTTVVAPGFIGFTPKSKQVDIKFQPSVAWIVANITSMLTMFVSGIFGLLFFRKKYKERQSAHIKRP